MSATATTLEERLRTLIASGLALPYASRSGDDGVVTGNHYQSVTLGPEASSGFRGDRAPVLDCIDFRGRKVLDLGSNLGEVSRSARSRGARLVDGIEADPFFVELARLITAYNGQSRVSFRQGDVTDPALYGERYDVVLALSVFHHVARVLDHVADVADVLVVETHKLHGDFDAGYLQPLQQRYQAMRVLGQTDWGRLGDGSEVRVAIAFAKDRARLEEALAAPHAWSQPPAVPAPRRSERVLDPTASTLHDAFFSAWDYEDPEALLAAVDASDVPAEVLAANGNLARHGYSGWVYWFLYLKGWLHHRATGEHGPDNPYHAYLAQYHAPSAPDLALGRALADPDELERTLRRRFADLDRFHETPDAAAAGTPPLRATVGPLAPASPLALGDAAGGAPVLARRVDGWHRVFGARALGVRRLRAEVVEEPRALPLLRGAVESYAIQGTMLRATGWCLDPDGPLDAIELREGGETIALALPQERTDVAGAHEDLPHAALCGFALAGELPDWHERPTRFQLLGLRDWLPVGRILLDHEPALFADPPPEELVLAAHGIDRTRLTLHTALAANALLDAVAHYRRLETFRDVAHWDAGCALLAHVAARRLGQATLTSLGRDVEALAWAHESGTPGAVAQIGELPPIDLADGALDLVLRERPLAQLDAATLLAWLDELRRVLRSGGYAALVGGWPAHERGGMLELCATRLNVVGAAIASAWPGGDVIVLRRP